MTKDRTWDRYTWWMDRDQHGYMLRCARTVNNNDFTVIAGEKYLPYIHDIEPDFLPGLLSMLADSLKHDADRLLLETT